MMDEPGAVAQHINSLPSVAGYVYFDTRDVCGLHSTTQLLFSNPP